MNARLTPREQIAARRTHARVAAIACLAGIGVTHALDLGHKWDEAPYVGVLFVLAIVASALLAAPRPPQLVWAAAGALAGSLMVGYFATCLRLGGPKYAPYEVEPGQSFLDRRCRNPASTIRARKLSAGCPSG